MARIPEIKSKADLPEENHHIFDSIAQSRGRVGFPFSLLLNSPIVAERAAHLGAYIRFESTLPAVEQELVILAAAREWDCQFEWWAHCGLGLEAGVRQEAIEAIANRRSLDQFTPDEALLVAYTRELLRDHRVSDATFEAARAKYGNKGVTELTATIGYYGMIACALNAFEAEAPGVRVPLP